MSGIRDVVQYRYYFDQGRENAAILSGIGNRLNDQISNQIFPFGVTPKKLRLEIVQHLSRCAIYRDSYCQIWHGTYDRLQERQDECCGSVGVTQGVRVDSVPRRLAATTSTAARKAGNVVDETQPVPDGAARFAAFRSLVGGDSITTGLSDRDA